MLPNFSYVDENVLLEKNSSYICDYNYTCKIACIKQNVRLKYT